MVKERHPNLPLTTIRVDPNRYPSMGRTCSNCPCATELTVEANPSTADNLSELFRIARFRKSSVAACAPPPAP